MPLRRMSEMLANVSQLFAQAQHPTDPTVRAGARARLTVIRDNLETEVKTIEAEDKSGPNRRVELAALRAALTTLTNELAAIEADEPFREPR